MSTGRLKVAVSWAKEQTGLMLIRDATPADWPTIWPFLQKIVAAGDTFTYSPELSEEEAEAAWMVRAPGRVVVAEAASGGVVGTANMYANRAGPGAHIASASYMVDPDHQGRGGGRALVSDSLRWARARGFRGMQFNAVAETNSYAIRLYESLGFTIIGTTPGGFRHPAEGDVGLHVMFCPL
ncbi:N-acetyltransferase family protein [Microbacterium sp. A82]|uniref:GNAT family N-acetyltransferase n=1 Tax=Microbacterium sp. A82 TaxID=3450452 RepID=UPI003F415FB9